MSQIKVLLFTRTDCPITNRYSPELNRLVDLFSRDRVSFWLIYVDPSESVRQILTHMDEYELHLPVCRDPEHDLVKRFEISVTPEVVVIDRENRLVYRGRIDDRYVDFGKARPRARNQDLKNVLDSLVTGDVVAFFETKAVGCPVSDL